MAEAEALKKWEQVNGVKVVDEDKFMKWDDAERNAIFKDRLWKKDPYYFKKCYISTVAMLKMVMHAKQGEPLEIMGMLVGQTKGDCFVITDVVSLSVEGTETRVNASADCDAYMLDYSTFRNKTGFQEPFCGWYHSHPSYKCWLSGIDCATEKLHQSINDPWIAVVVDPVTTSTNGKIEIGAFRTFPEGFKPDSKGDMKKVLPRDKIQDFGSYYDAYYTLKVELYKTKLDDQVLQLLWHEYWINTLASTAIISSKDIMNDKVIDLYEKYKESRLGGSGIADSCESILDDAKEIQTIYERGLKSLELKNILFNQKLSK
ncbi:MPN domain-containing protein [Entamoeba marina]